LVGLAIENLAILFNHLVYFTTIGNILWQFGIFCGNLEYFVAIWNILWSFGEFFPVLVFCAMEILATLQRLKGTRQVHFFICAATQRPFFSPTIDDS
jgi:hypothetical protein